tara:strand:+ start:33 stop:356 length:324 start_codon:yes stop_codon:yes gene_type:complete
MYGFKFNKKSAMWILTWFCLALAISYAIVTIPKIVKESFIFIGQPVLAETVTNLLFGLIVPVAWLVWYLSKPSCVSGTTLVDFLYFIFGGPFYVAARLTDKSCIKAK